MTGFLNALAALPLANLTLGGMSVELTMLALACVLGFVHLFLGAHFVTQERGTAWNVGARDNTPPLQGKLAGRLDRAFNNFRETFPIFAVAVLIITVLDRHNARTEWGAQLYFWMRVIYLPLYAAGVPMIRTIVWLLATVGILLVLSAAFSG
ncbi:MAG TPA: MAPEG family protein [Rhizomicrobium sp.]|nr:MAPEG family protein [Rhizomicrobium sp.]